MTNKIILGIELSKSEKYILIQSIFQIYYNIYNKKDNTSIADNDESDLDEDYDELDFKNDDEEFVSKIFEKLWESGIYQ